MLAAVLLAATCPAALAQQDSDDVPPALPAGAPKPPVPPVKAAPPAKQAREIEAAARAQERAERDVSRTFELAYEDKFDRVMRRTGAPLLIIPKDPQGKGTTESDQEDWQIMQRILEKAVTQREGPQHAMGITVRGPFGGMGDPRDVYLEGYGAVFFFEVNYPLQPLPTLKEEPQPKDNTKADWEEAKRELNHPAEPFVFNWSESPGPRAPKEEYSADKVDDLKKNVLQALKNAAHIKGLKSDETVTVIVTGAAPPGKMKSKGRPAADSNPNPPSRRATDESKVARLLVRAKKSDAESFLKEKLSFDDFRRKATVFIY